MERVWDSTLDRDAIKAAAMRCKKQIEKQFKDDRAGMMCAGVNLFAQFLINPERVRRP